MSLQRFIRLSNLIIGKITFKNISIEKRNLSNDGFQFIKNFISKEELNKLFPKFLSPRNDFEKEELLFNLYKIFDIDKSFHIKKRGKNKQIDLGMIDIINPNTLSQENQLHFNSNPALVNKIKEFIPREYSFTHYNLYIYNKCDKPRCLHIDSIKAKHIKAFIYLTNSKKKDGTYAYIPKSHKLILYNSIQFFINKIFGSDLGVGNTDGTLYSSKLATNFEAEVGDLLISDQRGVHGDMPRIKSGTGKIVLVLNYMKKQIV